MICIKKAKYEDAKDIIKCKIDVYREEVKLFIGILLFVVTGHHFLVY